jgi:cell division transport system permease protein
MRTRFILSEVGLGLRRNLTMTAASVVVVTLTLTLLGIALIVRDGTNQTEKGFLNQLNVSVFLEPECGTANAPVNCANESNRSQIQTTLQQLPQVKSVQFLSAADAYREFKQEFSNEPDLVASTSAADLPESFVVKLRDPKQFEVVKSAVSQAPGVQSVSDAHATLKKLFLIFHHISLLVLGFAAALLIATILLIYNAMRVAAFTRRRETSIMRLVGASDIVIQAPFVLEGILIGLVGSALATLFLVLARVAVHQLLDIQLLHSLGTWSTMFDVLPWVWVVGVLLPGLASFVTVQRHLRV